MLIFTLMRMSQRQIIQQILATMDADTAVKLLGIIKLLIQANAFDKKTIQWLVSQLDNAAKSDSSHVKNFSVSLPVDSKSSLVEWFLKEKFGNDIQVTNTVKDDTAIIVKGEGYGYKRSLDTDLQKLLWE